MCPDYDQLTKQCICAQKLYGHEGAGIVAGGMYCTLSSGAVRGHVAEKTEVFMSTYTYPKLVRYIPSDAEVYLPINHPHVGVSIKMSCEVVFTVVA